MEAVLDRVAIVVAYLGSGYQVAGRRLGNLLANVAMQVGDSPGLTA